MSAPAASQQTQRKRPDPSDVRQRVGDTNEQALRYVLSPDPKLGRLSRRVREDLIADLPAVTAGALLGPAALARHFIASAARGRYRDLFALWELFRVRPEECKPVLAERQQALDKGRRALEVAMRVGLHGRAARVTEDIRVAEGLIWQWMQQFLESHLDEVARRPAIASALLAREPQLELPLPQEPDERWLAEAATLVSRDEAAPAIAALVAANAHRLPPVVDNLTLAQQRWSHALPQLLERVDLDAPDAGRVLGWARDNGHLEALTQRLQARLAEPAERAEALRLWHSWVQRGLQLPLPDALRQPTLDGLDLGRPETAVLLASLVAEGAPLDPQAIIVEAADRNRQLAEKAYEAFVCAELDVQLPVVLQGNPIVREGTRCPACSAWTWVRPGHEKRCPRLAAAATPAATDTPPSASA